MADALATQPYVATLSRPGSYTRTSLLNAVDIDNAWAIARAAVAGTEWSVIRVILQPIWTGNADTPAES